MKTIRCSTCKFDKGCLFVKKCLIVSPSLLCKIIDGETWQSMHLFYYHYWAPVHSYNSYKLEDDLFEI